MRPLDPDLLRRSRTVRRHLAVATLLGTGTAALIVAQAWLVSVVVARGFHGAGTTATIGWMVLGIVGCFAARAVIGWGHRVVAARAAATVKSRLRREVVDALLDGSSRPSHPQSGHVIALLGYGLDALDGYFARYLPQLVLAATVPAVVVTTMLWADLLAAVTVAVTLPLVVVFMALVGWLTRARTERRWAALKRLAHHFADVLDGLVLLKVFGRSAGQVDGLRTVGKRHAATTMKALRLAFLSSFVLELCTTICVALVAVGVGLRVLEDGLSLQIGLFVLLLAPEAFLPVRQVGTHFHDSAEGAAAARDAFVLLDGPDSGGDRLRADRHLGDRGVTARKRPGPRIELGGVRVRYADRETDALRPIDLTVEPGELVALAGPSGCGKSTLLAVLLGFVEPLHGTITIAGVPRSDPAALRSRVAWVPQHPGLVAGTVADNVRLATSASDAQVRAALDSAAASMLDLDRRVAERGANLSAGERRRVAIARALLRARHGGADILLLDEPTAGLDASAERAVIDAIRAEGLTTLVVAHRAALLAAADRVVSPASAVVPA